MHTTLRKKPEKGKITYMFFAAGGSTRSMDKHVVLLASYYASGRQAQAELGKGYVTMMSTRFKRVG